MVNRSHMDWDVPRGTPSRTSNESTDPLTLHRVRAPVPLLGTIYPPFLPSLRTLLRIILRMSFDYNRKLTFTSDCLFTESVLWLVKRSKWIFLRCSIKWRTAWRRGVEGYLRPVVIEWRERNWWRKRGPFRKSSELFSDARLFLCSCWPPGLLSKRQSISENHSRIPKKEDIKYYTIFVHIIPSSCISLSFESWSGGRLYLH